MPHPGKDERRRRLDLVERTIQDKGWSGRIARGVASHLGVDVRTVYRYRSEVLEDIASGYRGMDRELVRGEFLLRLRENIERSQGAGRWGPVASLMGIEGKVLGVFVDTTAREEEAEPADLESVIDRLRELPAPVRQKLLAALAEGPAGD